MRRRCSQRWTALVAEPEPAGPTQAAQRGTTAAALARGAALIAVVTVAARLAGFARVVVFARTVGPTCLGDVYTTSNMIPNIVFDVVAGGALSSLVVPVVAGRVEAGADAEARQVAGALLGWMLAILVPVALAGGLLAHPLMDLLIGPGHPGCDRAAEVSLGADMLIVFAPQIVLYGLGVVLTGCLQARRRFFAPAVAPLLSSLVVLASYLLFAVIAGSSGDLSTHLQTDTAVLAIGTTLGVAALSIPLLMPALRRWPVRPSLRFPPGVGMTVLRLAVAGAVVLGSQQLATGVVLRLANSDGPPGAVVAYNLGWTVFLLPWAVLAVPIATSAFPALSAAWHRHDTVDYGRVTGLTTRAVITLTALAAAVMVAVAGPVARVLILGAPGALPTAVVARTVTAFAPGLVGFGLLAHLSRVRYARTDARSPARATAAGWLLAVIIDVIVATRIPAMWVPALLAGSAALGVTLAAVALLPGVLRDVSDRAALVRTTIAALLAAVLAAAAGRALVAVLPGGGVGMAVADTAAAGVLAALVGAMVVVAGDPTTATLVRRWVARGH